MEARACAHMSFSGQVLMTDIMYGNFLAGSHDTITSRIDQDVLQVCLRFRFFLPGGVSPRARGAIDGQSLTQPSCQFLCSLAKREGEDEI